MKVIFGLLLFLAIVYCVVGAVLAYYEHTQTDNPINWKTVITWLPRMLKGT